jgi:hypothetical protein
MSWYLIVSSPIHNTSKFCGFAVLATTVFLVETLQLSGAGDTPGDLTLTYIINPYNYQLCWPLFLTALD